MKEKKYRIAFLIKQRVYNIMFLKFEFTLARGGEIQS